MKNRILEKIEQSQIVERPSFTVGDKISVSVRLKEGDKERIQIFKGVVISKSPKSGKGPGATFTVRKVSGGVGVERIFPVHSPVVQKIEVESSSDVRQSRLYYLRELKGKKARLKEKIRFNDLVSSDTQEEPTEEEMQAANVDVESNVKATSEKASSDAETASQNTDKPEDKK